ncbi:DUF6415 family natural product biosynthesis protein [Streptomyces sp. NPDC047070]|uniref:DUF6415 family natural product biosynthesis protein n=1 Tax=Streptomyces sp. NPDC047070 TaxID=3154923 RepID=UPI00345288F3
MSHRTAGPPATAERILDPVDIETMRAVVRRFLVGDDLGDHAPSALGELATLLLQMRGHMQLLIPDIELATTRLPRDDAPRYCALACVGEARGKLSPYSRPSLDLEYAAKMARTLRALCDHYENLCGPAQ